MNWYKNQTKSDGKEEISKTTNKIARLKNSSTHDLEKQIKTTNKNNTQKRIDVETQTEVNFWVKIKYQKEFHYQRFNDNKSTQKVSKIKNKI